MCILDPRKRWDQGTPRPTILPIHGLNITGGVLPGAVGQLSVSTCDLVVSMISLVNNGVQIKVIIPWIGRHIVTWLLIRIVHSGYYTLSSN